MKYLTEEEKENHVNSLMKFCNDLVRQPKEKRNAFLIDFCLYARENITQEWFNIISIIKQNGNMGTCYSVVKWNEYFYTNCNCNTEINPKRNTKGTLIITPIIAQELNLQRNINEMKLHWKKAYVFPLEMMAIPPMMQVPTKVSIMQTVESLGSVEQNLDEQVKVANMIDWIDIDNFINCFLNNLVNSKDTGFILSYTKKEFGFFFELVKYCYVACTDFYDSDDVIESSLEIPDLCLLKKHDLFLVYHDICLVIRKFSVFLFEQFRNYIQTEIELQRKRHIKEKMNRNIAQRIADARIQLEQGRED